MGIQHRGLTPRPDGADTFIILRYLLAKSIFIAVQGTKPMADNHDHKHGEMDIRDQEKTFDGFMKWSTNVAIISILIVIGLAIFAT